MNFDNSSIIIAGGALLVSVLSLIVSVISFRHNRRLSENASALEFAQQYNQLSAAMATASAVRDQHLSVAAMLNFLENAAWLYNHRRVGSYARNNIRAVICDFVAGIGGIAAIRVLTLKYALGHDAYDELVTFVTKQDKLIVRQQRNLSKSMLNELD